jgi:predicted protein tyrosine phosphatase
MNILFVCSANKIRSVTAENHFRKIKPEHTYDSAGTNEKICKLFGTTLLSTEQAEWADIIYVMENKHFDRIKKHLNHYIKKVKVLNIKDIYKYNEHSLIHILEDRVKLSD